MQYTKKTTEFMQIYGLTAQEVYFCSLVAAGFGKAEAYAAIFKPSTTTAAQTGATKIAQAKPGINQLIRVISDTNRSSISGAALTAQANFNRQNIPEVAGKEQEVTDEERELFQTKQGIINALVATLPGLRGKERAAVLMHLADLQRMKQDDNKEEAERVIYYLPLTCSNCKKGRKS